MEYPEKRVVRWVDDDSGEVVGECEYVRADLVPQWQPIETAPRDGTLILTYEPCENPIEGIATGSYYAGRWAADGIMGVWFPTHWQPLPLPPETI